MGKSNPYRNPKDAWMLTEKGIELKYPIFLYDPTIPEDPIIKRTIEEVIGDIDFWGWEGNKEYRIIDSTGKVFITKFEKTNGHSLFIIPTEFQSGVFPGDIERIMVIEEIKEIMISGIDSNRIRIKENIDEFKKEVSSMNLIEDILKTCGKYF